MRERWTCDVSRAEGGTRVSSKTMGGMGARGWRASGAATERALARVRARGDSFVASRASARDDTPSVVRARHERATPLAALSSHRTRHASPTRRRVPRAVRPHRARPRTRPVRRADHQAGAFARALLDASTTTSKPPEKPRLDPHRHSPPRVLPLAHRSSRRAGYSTLRGRRRRPSGRGRRLAKVLLHPAPAPAQVPQGWLALPRRRGLRRRQTVHGSVRHVRGRHVRRRWGHVAYSRQSFHLVHEKLVRSSLITRPTFPHHPRTADSARRRTLTVPSLTQ